MVQPVSIFPQVGLGVTMELKREKNESLPKDSILYVQNREGLY